MFWEIGKGDLVGSDINFHLQYTSNGPSSGGGTGGNNDVIIKSSSEVRALTYCDLKCIHIHGLLDVLRLYPEFQQQFANDIQHDLTFNVREGYEAEVKQMYTVVFVLANQIINNSFNLEPNNHPLVFKLPFYSNVENKIKLNVFKL